MMADFEVSIPDGPQTQQVVAVLTQLLQKVGGSISPVGAGDQDMTQMGARANRPANLVPPKPTAGPAPMAPAAPPM